VEGARVLALFGIWVALVVVVVALCRLAGRGGAAR
jgi:hypothetical protein